MTDHTMNQDYRQAADSRQPSRDECRCAGTGRFVTGFTVTHTPRGTKRISEYRYAECAAHQPVAGLTDCEVW